MTTIVNTPPNTDSSGSSVGMILGLIVLVVVVGLFFVYALPAMRGSGAPQGGSIDVNLKLPAGTTVPAPATTPKP